MTDTDTLAERPDAHHHIVKFTPFDSDELEALDQPAPKWRRLSRDEWAALAYDFLDHCAPGGRSCLGDRFDVRHHKAGWRRARRKVAGVRGPAELTLADVVDHLRGGKPIAVPWPERVDMFEVDLDRLDGERNDTGQLARLDRVRCALGDPHGILWRSSKTGMGLRWRVHLTHAVPADELREALCDRMAAAGVKLGPGIELWPHGHRTLRLPLGSGSVPIAEWEHFTTPWGHKSRRLVPKMIEWWKAAITRVDPATFGVGAPSLGGRGYAAPVKAKPPRRGGGQDRARHSLSSITITPGQLHAATGRAIYCLWKSGIPRDQAEAAYQRWLDQPRHRAEGLDRARVDLPRQLDRELDRLDRKAAAGKLVRSHPLPPRDGAPNSPPLLSWTLIDQEAERHGRTWQRAFTGLVSTEAAARIATAAPEWRGALRTLAGFLTLFDDQRDDGRCPEVALGYRALQRLVSKRRRVSDFIREAQRVGLIGEQLKAGKVGESCAVYARPA